ETEKGSARMEMPDRNVSNEEFLAKARAIRDQVTPDSEAFLAKGLPQHVLDDLPKQIAALAAAQETRSTALQQRLAAGDALDETLQIGNTAIHLLYTIVSRSPAAPSGVVREFRLAKRVGPMKADDAAPAESAP